MSTLNVASINSGPIGGFRNALINGNPTINQRGYVSGTGTSGANQYTLDRWRVVTSGQSITWTDSQNVRTVTAPAGGVEQVIEGINLISGNYVLSWTGTATATVNGNAVANGASVTLTGGVDTTVRFSNGTFALAQLEPGTKATPFERRSYGQELALCQRYYEKSYSVNVAPASITFLGSFNHVARNSTDFYDHGPAKYKTEKRATPTLQSFNPSTGAAGNYWDSAGFPNGNILYRDISPTGHYAYASSALIANRISYYHWTASAEL